MSKIKKVVAVTSCATGIAHTFMAAKGLENEAKKRNIKIKVQKNAQGGIEDKLTAKEIKEADVVIIASDIKVDMSVFNGKKLVQFPVKVGMTKAKKIFDSLANATVYKHKGVNQNYEENQENVAKTFKEECKQIGKKSYTQLLTGISHMLPFVVAGGVLIAISFFWGIWSFDKEHYQYNAFAASLKKIGDAAFALMIPILAGYIAYSIGDRPALVPGMTGGWLAQNGFDGKSSGFIGAIIAGYMAGWIIILLRKGTNWIPKNISSMKPIIIYPLFGSVIVGLTTIWGINLSFDPLFNVETGLFTKWLKDMETGAKIGLAVVLGILISVDFGGPVNKVAYLFGVAALTTSLKNGEKSEVMAAVSAGCITPPLTTFVATTIFRNRFSNFEQQAGLTNLVLGSFHITEGAIPYAAKKPWINLPIFMVGSVISTTMSMLLGAATSAPHGGFVVIALVSKWYWWLLSILAGSVVSGVLLGISTKRGEAEKSNVIFASLS